MEASSVLPQGESGNDFKLRRRLNAKLLLLNGGILELALAPEASGGEGRFGIHCPLPFPSVG